MPPSRRSRGNGGKQVWGQMKKSAEKASRTGRRRAARRRARRQALEGDQRRGRVPRARPQRRRDPPRVLPAAAGRPEAGGRAAGRRAHAAPARARDHDRICSRQRLKQLIGPGKPITRLTTYTMTDELEQADSSLKPYGKSLLYLVSGRVRGRRAHADPRIAEEPQAGPAADSLLRPRRARRRSPTSCSRRPPTARR